MAEEGLVKLLGDLVEIPSVHPESTDDPSIMGEGRIATFLAGYLDELGFSTELKDVVPGRPNLIARFGPESSSKTILFEAHMDTVGVAGMKRSPFKPSVEEGRLYARGACDTKGPMAAVLWALRDGLCERLAEASVQIIFVGGMGEEKGNEGADQLMKERYVAADEAIILEPTDLDIIHTHKGALWYTITVTGVSVHGSNPELGVNAIEGMEQVMSMLRELTAEAELRFSNGILGKPTLSINTIRGGDELNIVPGTCSIEVDRRTLPEEDGDEILQEIRKRLEVLQKSGAFVSFDVDLYKAAQPFWTEPDAPLVRRLDEACQTVRKSSKRTGASWYSDAGPLSVICKETVVFGPGSIKQAHTSDEFIDLEELQAGADILRKYLESSITA